MKPWHIAAIASFMAAAPVAAQTASASAAAASPVELAGSVQLVKVTEVNGQKQQELVEPKVVVPGDKLIFSTRYRNASSQPVSDFVVTNPLPAAVMLAGEDAAQHTVSVDGGKTWGKLAALTVADGQGGKRPATAADVTHLRWILALLQPGATGALTYHAIVR